MEFGGSLPSRANLRQNVPLRYSHFVSLESSEVLDAATEDPVRLFQLKVDPLPLSFFTSTIISFSSHTHLHTCTCTPQNDTLLQGRIQLIEVAANSVLAHEGDLVSV